jgi:hypothetical protein
MKLAFKFILTFAIVFLAIPSCKLYKFTGASIPPEVQTVSIGNFPNLAPIQVGSLSNVFVDKLTEKIVGGTRLRLAGNNTGDISISGSIKDYYVNPTAISGTELTQQNRLTITVQVDYISVVKPSDSFSQTFSDGENYDASLSLIDVENELIAIITERLAESIFNKAFVNW